MNAAHNLYETFTKNTDAKLIINTAYEIEKHFSDVSKKDYRDTLNIIIPICMVISFLVYLFNFIVISNLCFKFTFSISLLYIKYLLKGA